MKRGIALLVTVGILTLLVLAGTAMIGMAAQLRVATSAGVDKSAARLLARSGLEYASARVGENSASKTPPTRENQPDDWAFRDDPRVPQERAANPSYAQTEPYTDTVPANGRYDPGSEPYVDVNGNGRFDSWSGRLRGRYGMASGTFALRIESEGGTINVNDGYLDGLDRNGNRVPESRDLGLRLLFTDLPGFVSEVPDWTVAYQETYGLSSVVQRNRRVADLVNELADAAGVSQPPWIGNRVIERRPLGGYRDLASLRSVLGAETWSRLGACLSASPSFRFRRAVPSQRSGANLEVGVAWDATDLQTAVNLEAAPIALLQAISQRITAGRPDDICWMSFLAQFEPWFPYTVQPPEARLLAQGVAAARGEGRFPSWCRFFQWLDAGKYGFFAGTLLEVNHKVDAVELHWNPSDVVASLEGGGDPVPAVSWLSYDLDRDIPNGSPDLRRGRAWRGFVGRRALDYSPLPISSPDRPGAYGNWGGSPVTLAPRSTAPFRLQSLGTIAPPAGGAISTRMEGTLQISRLVSAKSQADFENLSSFEPLPFPEVPVTAVSEGVELAGRPLRDRMQTWPSFPLDSCPDYKDPNYFYWDSYWQRRERPHYGTAEGTVRLMDDSAGWSGRPQEAFYAPFWEMGQPLRDPREPLSNEENCRDASARGKAASGETCFRGTTNGVFPGSGFGTYLWQGNGGDDFPLASSGGTIPQGTLECVFLSLESMLRVFFQGKSIVVSSAQNLSYKRIELYNTPWPVDLEWSQDAYAGVSPLKSIRPISMPEPHPIAFTFGPGGVQGYIDGIPDPGLFEAPYLPPAVGLVMLNFRGMDEVRLYTSVESSAAILKRALDTRYWLSEPAAAPAIVNGHDLRALPRFTSALYRFARPVALGGCRWDGFVPRLIAQATERANAALSQDRRKVPIGVELLAYDRVPDPSDYSGEGARVIRLPDRFWVDGGGWKGLDVPNVRALRYRITMDASAPTEEGELNNETPVFDSITIAYLPGRKVLSLSED